MRENILNSVLILLLLYETTSSSPVPNENTHYIPVWARKAGFHLHLKSKAAPLSSVIQHENQFPTEEEKPFNDDNEEQLQSLLSTTQKLIQNQDESPEAIINKSNIVEEKAVNYEAKQTQDEDEEAPAQMEDYDEDEEKECPENQFWHLRGKRCVSVRCPGGNSWRDVETGECILRQFRKVRGWRQKYSRKFGTPARSLNGLVNGHWASG